jgi:hypothetical protein
MSIEKRRCDDCGGWDWVGLIACRKQNLCPKCAAHVFDTGADEMREIMETTRLRNLLGDAFEEGERIDCEKILEDLTKQFDPPGTVTADFVARRLILSHCMYLEDEHLYSREEREFYESMGEPPDED